MHTALALAALSLLHAIPPVEVPWGKAETKEERKALAATAVCTDGKSHFVVVAPHEKQIHQLFYGDGQKFNAVPHPPWVLTGGMFLEPRFVGATMNSDFRGVDLRVYSSVDYDAEKQTCSLRCGERTTTLQILDAEKTKAMLLAAKVEPTPQEYVPHALLRDDAGRYFYVDKGFWPDQAKNFRVFVGQKGSLKPQKMINVVADSEGEIFSTKGGELRMVIDRTAPPQWIQGGKKTTLRDVPVEQNLPLIYNELGVYTGIRLGTPCDDL